MIIFHFQDKNLDPFLSSNRTFHSFPRPGFLLFLLFLFAALFLPPGEEGSSALETLCVGLTIGSLRCSGCFDNYWGHLDQLQGCFTILQGLAQVQNLSIKWEIEKVCQNKNTCGELMLCSKDSNPKRNSWVWLNSWKRSDRNFFFPTSMTSSL